MRHSMTRSSELEFIVMSCNTTREKPKYKLFYILINAQFQTLYDYQVQDPRDIFAL